jgi:hypothetical protein
VEIGELSALRGKSIEVGSFESLRAEAPNIGVALIVGEDEDDVGRCRFSDG